MNVDDLNQRQAREAGLQPGEGVLITRVAPGSAAAKSGLQAGDVVIAINDSRTRSVPELQEQIARLRPGESLALDYIRDGRQLDVAVTLQQVARSPLPSRDRPESIDLPSGMEVRELTKGEQERFGRTGLLVQSVVKRSAVDAVNLEPGFIIKRINGIRIDGLTDALPLLEAKELELKGVYTDYPGEFTYIFRND